MSLSGLRAAYFQGSLSSCVGALGLCFKICGTAPLLVGGDEVYVSVREQVCVCVHVCTCARVHLCAYVYLCAYVACMCVNTCM